MVLRILCTILIIMLSTPVMAGLLDQYKWEKRLLIVHAPSIDNHFYKQQLSEYRLNEAGVEDRDMKLITLIANEPLDDYDQWVNAFHFDENGFAVVLVGKDGTEKQRWDDPVMMNRIFQIIDSMPMRQREMNDGS